MPTRRASSAVPVAVRRRKPMVPNPRPVGMVFAATVGWRGADETHRLFTMRGAASTCTASPKTHPTNTDTRVLTKKV